jgi:hypothetical protein
LSVSPKQCDQVFLVKKRLIFCWKAPFTKISFRPKSPLIKNIAQKAPKDLHKVQNGSKSPLLVALATPSCCQDGQVVIVLPILCADIKTPISLKFPIDGRHWRKKMASKFLSLLFCSTSLWS